MKITKRLMVFVPVFLVFCCTLLTAGCSHTAKSEVNETITGELDLLKNLDSETAQKYISYKELFPDAAAGSKLPDGIEDLFSLFFRDFNYKILDTTVGNDKTSASASLRLTTIDARSVAEDYAASLLEFKILEVADHHSQNTNDTEISLENYYLLLNSLLKDNKYKTAETNCTMELENTGDKDNPVWEIRRTYSLENDLVGGLMTYLSDPDILSPENTLAVYMDTLKKMDLDEISSFLGVASILNTSDPAKNSIATALVEQVHSKFNYKIKDCTVDGYTATVNTEITTFDSDTILADYQSQLDEYLASPDAVINGSSGRYQKSLELLLDSIEENTSITTTDVSFVLVNDGASWKLENESTRLGDAIFGTLTTTPVNEENAAD